MNETKPEKLFNSAYIAVFIANLFQMMGQQTISALVPKYASAMGATASIVGIVSGIFAISAIAVRPVASPAFDCFSKKRLLQMSLCVISLSYILFIIAPNVNFIIAGRLLQGIGIGCCAPLGLSLACESVPDGMLGRAVSFFSLGQAFGQAIGPSIGLALARSIGYPPTFVVCFCMMVISLVVLTIFFKGGKAPENAVYRIRLKSIIAPKAIPAAALMAIMAMSYACINGFLAIYGGLLELDNIGLYFTVYAVGLLIFRPLTGGLADKYGPLKVLIPGMICYAGTFLCLSLARSMVMVIAAAVCGAAGYGISQPTIQAICMKSVPKESRGVGSNTLFLGQDIGQFAGPWLAGIAVDGLIAGGMEKTAAYSTAFMLLIIPIAVDIVLLFLLRKKISGK